MDGLLVPHIAAGSLALVSALTALTTHKGGKLHRYAGQLYFASMVIIFITAVIMSLQTSNIFLLLVALFSFYLAFSGWRFARNRSGNPHWIDWLAVSVLAFSGMLMWFLALQSYPKFSSASVPLGVFGLIAIVLSFFDARSHRDRAARGKVRIAKHLANMLGGTIAVSTAVLVVNISFAPAWLGWILPTILTLPVIIWWGKKVKA